MLLLIFVTIYIYNKFAKLAVQKNLSKSRWGLLGAGLYLGIGIGFQFFVGILIGFGFVDMDIENRGIDIALSLVSYALGGLAAYIGYQKLLSMPDENPNIDNFGEKMHDDK